MSPAVTYLPAYLGLFASLTLAIACNAYLDIQYGSFGPEVLCWSVVFALTLRIAWKQGGSVSERGLFWQKTWLILGLLLSVLLFLPMWGLPRGGLYALAALQAATNCVTVNRRKFMMALMASAVMVMFATTHFRADWTMMFYLLPYLFAVVFTLVAEQVSRRLREVRREGSGLHLAGGQGASIVAATTSLLAVTLIVFALTPQVTWLSLKWKYGQVSNIGIVKAKEKGADGGNLELGGAGGTDAAERASGADGHAGPGDQDIANGEAGQSVGDGYRESVGQTPAWPTLKEMREAAKRPGMPVWQAAAIEKLVVTVDGIERIAQPLQQSIREAAKRAAKWLENNRQRTIVALMLLILLALLGGAATFLRELRPILWLRMQFDFLRFGLLGLHASGNAAARQYYGAMERLFLVHHVEREARFNTREYLARLHRIHAGLRREASEMTWLFEQARYGKAAIGADEVTRMRQLYRRMYAVV